MDMADINVVDSPVYSSDVHSWGPFGSFVNFFLLLFEQLTGLAKVCFST
jgi:hypothetical protein